MPPQLTRVGTYATEVEAEHMRAVLADVGITSFVQGGHASNAMSHVGSAVDTMLLVPASIADRAREILVGHESADSQATEWFCGACGETNEATFDVCWSCGAERETASAPFPDSSETSKGVEQTETPVDQISENPFRPPGTEKIFQPTQEQLDQIDVKLTRAMRCGFIGLGFFQVILQLYGLYLLKQVFDLGIPSEEARQRWNRAAALNVVGLLFYGSILFLLLFVA